MRRRHGILSRSIRLAFREKNSSTNMDGDLMEEEDVARRMLSDSIGDIVSSSWRPKKVFQEVTQPQGRFWCGSDSEVDEDLGDVEGNVQVCSPVIADQIIQVQTSKPDKRRQAKMPHAKGCWPWDKSRGWKGPLPKARCSPLRTFGDFLKPKLDEACLQSSTSPAALKQSRPVQISDPKNQPVQISNERPIECISGPGSDLGPRDIWALRNPGLASLHRRLSRKPSTRKSYAQVLMAGGVAATGGGSGAAAGGGGDQTAWSQLRRPVPHVAR